jgi:hypothetical protein
VAARYSQPEADPWLLRELIGFTDTDDASEALERRKPVAVVYPDQNGLGTLVIGWPLR